MEKPTIPAAVNSSSALGSSTAARRIVCTCAAAFASFTLGINAVAADPAPPASPVPAAGGPAPAGEAPAPIPPVGNPAGANVPPDATPTSPPLPEDPSMPVLVPAAEETAPLTEGTEEIPEGGYPRPAGEAIVEPVPESEGEESAAEEAADEGPALELDAEVPLVAVTYPGMYGGLPQTFFVPANGVARPKFSSSISLGVGYDDNRNQRNNTDRVGYDPRFDSSRSNRSEIEEDEPGNFFSQASVSTSVVYAARKNVFSLDLGATTQYFPGSSDGLDLDARLGVNFARQLSSKVQFSTGATIAYRSQPDTARVNASSRQAGDALDAVFQANLSYRLTRKLTTTSTFALDTILYQDSAEESSSYYSTQFGQSLSFRWYRNLSLVLDGRYALVTYDEDSTRDSETLSLLAGAEYRTSSRLSTSLRIGASRRESDSQLSEGASTSPFMEAAGSWRYASRGTASLTGRYGFEEGRTAGGESRTFRLALSLNQALTSRISGNASAHFARREESGALQTGGQSEDTFGAGLGLGYRINKNWSASFSYNYTRISDSGALPGYSRNRILCGLTCSF